MKHSDFGNIADTLKNWEITELVKALQAHNGHYSWDADTECAPIVAAYTSWGGIVDVRIDEISLNKQNGFSLTAVDIESQTFVDIGVEDVMPGQVSYIIDYLPQTEKVKDVSISEFRLYDISTAIDLLYISTWLQTNGDLDWNKLLHNADNYMKLTCQFVKSKWYKQFKKEKLDYESAVEAFCQALKKH